MVRVFISSVIKGFGAERKAAREAARTVGLQPVMAEDFGAKSCTPQQACLEGVRSSDVYVGILAARYGHVAESGISVTEEEFNEARQQGKPIYWFATKCEREPLQEKLLERVQGYEDGYHLAFFENPAQLAAQITQALNDYGGGLRAVQLSSAEAAQLARQYAADAGLSRGTDTAVGAVLIPVQKRQFLSLSALSKKGKQDELLQPALFGASQVLDSGLGTEREEKENSLAFTQSESRGRLTAHLEFRPDGSLVWLKTLLLHHGVHCSLVRSHVVDEAYVETLLESFFRYAQQYYNGLPSSSFLSQFYMTCLFYNMKMRWFGRIPSQEPNAMCMPMSEIESPLLVPSELLRIARARLGQPTQLATEVVEEVARVFRVGGRYYQPDGP